MKCGILITARLKSSRLPMKVMKEIHDRPMIVHMIDRLKLAKRPNEIIICTSTLTQDDPLVEVARKEGIEYYRGSPEDVLLRLTTAAAEFGVETVVSCTADNPFVDPEYIDRLVDFHLEYGFDYSRSEGLPFGTFTYTMKREAMLRACAIKASSDTEVWGGYFTESGLFSWGTLKVEDGDVRWPELRLTVDTPEDFELISRIFDELYEPGRVFPLREIVRLCRNRHDLVAINDHVHQKSAKPVEFRANQLQTNRI